MTAPVATPDVVRLQRVMLVDDHVVLADLLANAMADSCFEATVVPALPEVVLERAATGRFDLAILDVSFSDGATEGVELIRPLCALGMKVLMLTGLDDPLVHARCLREGAAGVVSKAQSFDNLVDALEAAANDRSVHAVGEWRRLIDELERHEAERTRRLAPFRSLTPREEQILVGLSEGLNATELAQRGYVSLATVRAQVRSILSKLGAHSQLAAVAAARDADWEPAQSNDGP